MNPKRKQRLLLILAMIAAVFVAVALAMYSLSQSINQFKTPTQIANGEAEPGQTIRAGGLVVEGSVQRDSVGLGVRFNVTDGQSEVTIFYDGILPDLFREGQGIVALGSVDQSGLFTASQVLAKHDENYMPPEVMQALEEANARQSETSPEAYQSPASPEVAD